MNYVRVALDVPLPTLFDYRAATATRDDIGRRVLVPFGRKIAVGVIIELALSTSLPPQKVRSVLSVLHDVPPLSGDILALLKFCSGYYHHPLGEAVLNALPTRLRRRQPLKAPAGMRHYRLTAAGLNLDPGTVPRRAAIKLCILGRLRDSAAGLDETAVRAIAPRALAVLRTMIGCGWVEPVTGSQAQLSQPAARALQGPALTVEQRDAAARIRGALEGFSPWLLLGITGSGKTEVYLDLVAATLQCGRQALLLVPEINLTPQLEARVRARFPATELATLHSSLNESERLHYWLAAQSGSAGIVLGTRLAVFAPMPRLGLIIVDEEHDASFKQTDGLRYSARDTALLRAKRLAIPVVLGSATPALETFHQALRGRYRLLTLTQRVNAALPAIECVDTRRESLIDGLTQTLLGAVRDTLKRGEQSLIFINRRGYAPVLMCPGCGWAAGCHRCAARLVLHLEDHQIRCHHCGHQERVPAACPVCGNRDLAPLGQGTQRIESTLRRIFPAARILRVDRDTTRRKHSWSAMRRQIHAREVDILVGTQILAKGHDFPQLTLVGVVNADSSLYSADFRAGERLFAGLTQVAGRAGRAENPGRVLIQTEFPAHPLYQALRRHDYVAYAHTLLSERKQAGFPPFAYQAVLRAEAPKLETALAFLARAASHGLAQSDKVTIYDPVPAGMPRRAGLDRAQLTVQAASRTALQAFLREWYAYLSGATDRNVRWGLDVDPQEL